MLTKDMLVGDILKEIDQKKIYSLPGDKTILEAAGFMKKNNISLIFIIENGNFKGIVTERDFVWKGISLPTYSKVNLIATPPGDVLSVNPRETFEEVSKLMDDHGVRHLPVMEGEKILGVISMRDLNRLYVRADYLTAMQR